MPHPDGSIPLLYLATFQMVHDAPVVIIPSHLRELPRCMLEAKNRVPGGAVDRAGLAGCVGGDRGPGKEGVVGGVELLEDGGDVEAVHKEGRATFAICVGQQVE